MTATCCWCDAPLVKYGLHWWCGGSVACQARQIRHAQYVQDAQGRVKEWLYVPLPTQTVWHEAAYDPSITRLLAGGQAGPGKSRWLRETLYEFARQVPGFHGLLLRKTHKDLDQSHLRFMPYEVGMRGGTWKAGERVAVFPHRGQRDAIIRAGHLEDVGAVENYLSSEYDVIAPDELVTFERDPMLELFTRARSTNPALLALRGNPAQDLDGSLVLTASNPGGRGALWVKEHFIDHTPDPVEFPQYKKARWAFYGAKLADNPYMAHGYREALEGLRASRRRQLLDGDWNVFEGQMFEEWREDHHVQRLAATTDLEWFCGLDWGYNAPFVCGWYACLPDGKLYRAREWKDRGIHAEDFAKRWWEITRRELGLSRVRYVVADPAIKQKTGAGRGESVMETLQRYGLPMTAGDNDRVNGWHRLHERLRPAPDGTPWLIVDPSCQYLRRTLPAAPSAPKNPEDVDPTFAEDHALDELRYAMMSRPSPTRYTAPSSTFHPLQAGALLQEAMAASTDRHVLGAGNVRGQT
jgi:hypothetical protein